MICTSEPWESQIWRTVTDSGFTLKPRRSVAAPTPSTMTRWRSARAVMSTSELPTTTITSESARGVFLDADRTKDFPPGQGIDAFDGKRGSLCRKDRHGRERNPQHAVSKGLSHLVTAYQKPTRTSLKLWWLRKVLST